MNIYNMLNLADTQYDCSLQTHAHLIVTQTKCNFLQNQPLSEILQENTFWKELINKQVLRIQDTETLNRDVKE